MSTSRPARPVPGPEFAETTKELYAGKPTVVVNNVSQPTMTVYSPQGETLSQISYKYYGSTGQWRKIFEANRETVKDANTVRSGTKLIIPD